MQPTLLSVDVFNKNKLKRENLTKKLINKTIKYGEFLFDDDNTYINHFKIGKSVNWFSEVKKIKSKTPDKLHNNVTWLPPRTGAFIPL